MNKIPVGSAVLSRFGQAGIIVPLSSQMWPTLVEVKWVGTSFTTVEDPHKLELIDSLAEGVQSSNQVAFHRVPAHRSGKRPALDAHTALLARARQRAGVAA